jgi:hypothetical protein
MNLRMNCVAVRQCGSVQQCEWQCVSAHGSVRAVCSAVCGSALGSVWQCARQCAAVQRLLVCCSAAVRQCGSVAVRQCAAVVRQWVAVRCVRQCARQCAAACGNARGGVRLCAW